MKTKQFNKIFIYGLTLLLMLTAILTFSACKDKNFEPRDISIEQAQTLLDEAKMKMNNASSVYYEFYVDGEIYTKCYANSEWYYEDSGDEQWWIYNDTLYIYVNDSGTGVQESLAEENYDTYIEFIFDNSEVFSIFEVEFTEIAQQQGNEITARQTAENKYEINVKVGEEEVNIIIENGYLVSVGDELKVQYNVTKTIPEVPDIDWQ